MSKSIGSVNFGGLFGKKTIEIEPNVDNADFWSQALSAFDPEKLDRGEIIEFTYQPKETPAQKFRRLLSGDDDAG